MAKKTNPRRFDNNLPRSKFKEVHMSLAEALKTRLGHAGRGPLVSARVPPS